VKGKYKIQQFIAELRESGEWNNLWDSFEMDIAMLFLRSDDHTAAHNRLQAARQLRAFMESINE
jgi:hypothetical protein